MKLTRRHHETLPIRDGGFTLIELLVVIAVMSVLAAIAALAVVKVRDSARDSANRMLVNAVSTGLDHYRNEFNALPPSQGSVLIDNSGPVREDWYGAQFLAQAMLGGATMDEGDPRNPASVVTAGGNLEPIDSDMYEGYGFRAKLRGKVYGPYVDPKNKTGLFGIDGDSSTFRYCLIDYDAQPLLYYRALKDANTSTPIYRTDDNWDDQSLNDAKHYVGGPMDGGAKMDVDEYVMRGSTVDINDRTDLPDYLLCTRGGDEKWGKPNDNTASDDVVNLPE